MISKVYGEMSVKFLSVGTYVRKNRYILEHDDMDGKEYVITHVAISQEIVGESGISTKAETTVLYDLLEIDENAEDVGNKPIKGIKSEFVVEI